MEVTPLTRQFLLHPIGKVHNLCIQFHDISSLVVSQAK